MRYNSTYKKLELKFDVVRYARIKQLVKHITQSHENENFYITKPLSVLKNLNKNKAMLFVLYNEISLAFKNANRIREIREETNDDETSYYRDRFHLFNSIFKDERNSLNLDLYEIPKHDFYLEPNLEMVYQYIENRPDINKHFVLPTNKTINTFQISTTPITTNLWNGLALVDTFKDIQYNKHQEDPLSQWHKYHSKDFRGKDRIGDEELATLERLLSQYNPKNVPMTNVSFYEAILFCNKLSEYFGLEPYYNIKSYKRCQYILEKPYDEDVINSKIFDWSNITDNITYFNVYKDDDYHEKKIIESYFDRLWKVNYSDYDDGNISGNEDFGDIDSKIKTKMRKDSEREIDDDYYDYANEFKGFEDLKSHFEFPDIYDKRKNKIVYNNEFYYLYSSDTNDEIIGFKNILEIPDQYQSLMDDKNPINEKSNGFRLPFSWELLSIISLELNGVETDLIEGSKLTTKDSNLDLHQYERLTPKERLVLDVQHTNQSASPNIFCSSTKRPYLNGVYDIVGNVYKWVNDTFFIDKEHIIGDSENGDGGYIEAFGGTAIAFGCSYKDDVDGNISITHDNLFKRLAIKQGYEDVGFFVCRNTKI